MKAGTFRATTDQRELADVDVIDICVPTPLRKTRDPDLSYVVKAIEATAAVLRKGQLVILESTTYPGTTEEVAQPALEAGGLKVGRDFYLAFSPERVDPGNQTYTTKNIPKVVGGIDQASTDLAAALYGQVVDKVVQGRQHARRRDGEAAREHVPRGQHRPRERNRADVPSA